MYRSVILDFIFANDKTFKDNLYVACTLVLFPYKTNNNIESIFENSNEVCVYHIKEPYTFTKKYDFNQIKDTLLEMAIEYNKKIDLKFDEITFEINDPYYLKDIRNISFKSLSCFPIYEENNIIAMVIVYSDLENVNLNISNNKWLSLINRLKEDQRIELLNSVTFDLAKNANYYFVITSKDVDFVYINDSLLTDLDIKTNITKKNSKDIKKIDSFCHKASIISKNDYDIYYMTKFDYHNINKQNDIYLIDSINSHSFSGEYSIIFAKDIDNNMTSVSLAKVYSEGINKAFTNIQTKIYSISEFSIAIIVNKSITKKDDNNLRYYLKKMYYVLINVPKELPYRVDLIKVMDYLDHNIPSNFDYNEYTLYNDKKNLEKLNCINSFSKNKSFLYSAVDFKKVGTFVSLPLKNYYFNSTYKTFEKESIYNFEYVLNHDIDSPIISLLLTSVSKRKIWEQLKKTIVKYSNTKLILHIPPIFDISSKDVFETISKLKNLGFIIIVDSTIYMNLQYNNSLKLVDAIIIRKHEIIESLTYCNEFNKKIFDYFYDEGKVVIFEKMIDEKDASIVNELTCFILDEDEL